MREEVVADRGDEAKGYYVGYSEPSDQWEAEGRVTWDADLTLQA